MPDADHEVDIQGASVLITGEGIGPERQAKVYAIGQKLGVRPHDELFTVLVLLESYAHLFSGVPDKMAVAAKEAASGVGEAARETTQQVIAETVTETVDQRAFARRFRGWALGTVLGTTLVTGGFGYVNDRLTDANTNAAEQLYRQEVAKAEEEIEAVKQSVVQASTAAAARAAIVAAQETSKVYEDKLADDLKYSVDQRVANGLKIGQDNATTLKTLLRLEAQQPGALNALEILASAGWQALVQANPTRRCAAQGYDESQQKKTCILWMP